MTWRPPPLPPVPEATVAAVRAAFPKGNPYVDLRTAFGTLYLDWEAQQTHYPQGYTSVNWRPGRDVSGDPVIRIRFDGATCRACPTRRACTSAQAASRQLTVRPQVHHEAVQAARQRQETPEFKARYALRAGVESRLSQGVRRFDLRRRPGHFARIAPRPLSRQAVLC
jgi:hypothetical protein